jgi:hypothetical protein
VAGTDIEHRSSDGAESDAHGALEQSHSGTLVSYNPDAPSEEWGWHGHWSDFAPRGRFLLLSLGVAGLLLMIIGNHQSHVEDYYLVLIAALMAAWMLRTYLAKRRERRIRP